MSAATPNPSPSDDLALEVHGLARSFRRPFSRSRTQAVADLDLGVRRASFVHVAGPNGAGKSTLLRLIAGLDRPDQGRVTVLGGSPRSPSRAHRVAFAPDHADLPPHLTADEMLAFYSGIHGGDRRAEVDSWRRRLGIDRFGGTRLGRCSLGMRKRVALAGVLIGRPEILLLDEPRSGLDPEAIDLLSGILEEEKGRGATILMSSHDVERIEPAVDRVLVLKAGRLFFDGTVDALCRAVGESAVEVRSSAGADPDALVSAIASAGGVIRARGLPLAAFARFVADA